MMVFKKKPKPPQPCPKPPRPERPVRPVHPGKPSGEIGCYELRRVLSTFLHSSAAVLVSLVSFAAMFATQENVDMMWEKETVSGTIGVLVVTLLRFWSLRQQNNCNRKI